MSSDPRKQGGKDDFCGLPTSEKRKSSIFEGSNMPGGRTPQDMAGKSAQGDAACSKDSLTLPLKIDIPKENPPINPKYSSQTPIVLNKLPIFEENESTHL